MSPQINFQPHDPRTLISLLARNNATHIPALPPPHPLSETPHHPLRRRLDAHHALLRASCSTAAGEEHIHPRPISHPPPPAERIHLRLHAVQFLLLLQVTDPQFPIPRTTDNESPLSGSGRTRAHAIEGQESVATLRFSGCCSIPYFWPLYPECLPTLTLYS